MRSFRLAESVGRRDNKVWILAAIVVFLVAGWTHGTFDNFLWRVGLNHGACYQNGFGAVLCGDAATQYQQRLKDAGIKP